MIVEIVFRPKAVDSAMIASGELVQPGTISTPIDIRPCTPRAIVGGEKNVTGCVQISIGVSSIV
jgi:hypothetical protein